MPSGSASRSRRSNSRAEGAAGRRRRERQRDRAETPARPRPAKRGFRGDVLAPGNRRAWPGARLFRRAANRNQHDAEATRRDAPSPDLPTTGARPRLAPETAAALKHDVYVYVDSIGRQMFGIAEHREARSDAPFYIGKGHGTRVLAHVSGHGNARTTARIEEIRSVRQEPRIDILVHGIEDHETACKVEAAAIDLLAAGSLTNSIRGRGSVEFGRRRLQELDALYGARPVEIVHPSILIRINQRYRPGMSEQELYESTRGVWKLGPRRETAKLALAVFRGVVREVYEIGSWHQAGTTAYATRGRDEVDDVRQVEFVGAVASPEIRKRYLWGDVRRYLKEKSQNPVCYAGDGMSGRGGGGAQR